MMNFIQNGTIQSFQKQQNRLTNFSTAPKTKTTLKKENNSKDKTNKIP